jgi:dihydrodipicolinate reductase
MLGRDAGELAGLASNGVAITDDALPVFARAEGVLDFTAPAATLEFAELAAQARIVHVIGTTGMGESDEGEAACGLAPCPHRQIRQYEPWGQSAFGAGAPGSQGA